MDSEFLSQHINFCGLSEVERLAAGAGKPNLNAGFLKKYRIFLPEISEQRKISSSILSVDQRIQLLQRKKAKLEQYKKGVMQRLFAAPSLSGSGLSGLPDEQDEEDNLKILPSSKSRFRQLSASGLPGLKDEPDQEAENPSIFSSGKYSFRQLRFKDENGNDFLDWEEKKLGEIATINMGQSPPSKSYNDIGNGLYLIQGNADISKRLSKPRQWTDEPTRKCEIGDLLMTVRAPVGSISKSIHNACIGRGVCALKANSITDFEYLYQYLVYFEPRWISIEQGSTFTAVSGADMKALKIPFPSLPEQKKIATFFSSIDTAIEKVNYQINASVAFKKGLLQKMFV